MEILNTFADDIAIAPLLILAAVELAAGFFDAIAGGGGLITVPALLLGKVCKSPPPEPLGR